MKLGIAAMFVAGLTRQSVNGTVLTGAIELVVELDVALEEAAELLVTGGAEDELVVVVTTDVVVVDLDDSVIAAYAPPAMIMITTTTMAIKAVLASARLNFGLEYIKASDLEPCYKYCQA
jgi:hypothetical protein